MCQDDPTRPRVVNRAHHFAIGHCVFEAINLCLFFFGNISGGVGSILALIGASVVACCSQTRGAFVLHVVCSAIGLALAILNLIIVFAVVANYTVPAYEDDQVRHEEKLAKTLAIVFAIIFSIPEIVMRILAVVFSRQATREATASGQYANVGAPVAASGVPVGAATYQAPATATYQTGEAPKY